MAAKKKSNLTLAKVKSVSKALDKMEQYEITDGEYKGETISFYPTFSHTVIEEVLVDLQALIKEALEKEIKISDEMYLHLINFLAIKHFTHFKKDITSSSLLTEGKETGLIDWIKHFRKTGLYKEIIEEVFLATEVKKVIDHIVSFTATGVVMGDLEQQMQDKVASLKFKYSDVFEQVGKIGEARNVLANPIN